MGICVSKREYQQIVQEKEQLQKEIEKLKSLIINTSTDKEYNPINFYDIIIYIQSINDITKGWKVELSKRMNEKYKEFAENKVVKIGVIGNSNKGKSFILSKISGIYLPFGTSLKTQGLSIKFPELKKYPTKTIALLDSAGLETPVLLIKDKIENKNEKNGNENINKNLEKKIELQKKIELFREESRDKIITEFFLQNYIIHYSDILLLVVGILTYSEQKLLNKVKSELMRITKDKTLYVIHNLMTFTTKIQVENYINETLLKSATFNLEKQMIPNQISECYYEKGSKPLIKHLFLAFDTSEAGKYYNKFTLEYLEKAYITIVNIEPFDVLKTVKERFTIVSKEILEKNEKEINFNNKNEIIQEPIVFYDDPKKELIKLVNPQKIKLKKCLIDEIGLQNLKSNDYEPSYNCYQKGNEIIITVEAPGDSYLKEPKFIRSEGYTFIRIAGNKNKDQVENYPMIHNSRESGEFILDIPLKYEDFWLKNKKPIIHKENGLFIIKYELDNSY
jgi:hypothetical protein